MSVRKYSCLCGNIKKMIDLDCEVDHPEILLSAKFGNLDMVRYLVKRGCDYSHPKIYKLASCNGHLHVKKYLKFIKKEKVVTDYKIEDICKLQIEEVVKMNISFTQKDMMYIQEHGDLTLFKYVCQIGHDPVDAVCKQEIKDYIETSQHKFFERRQKREEIAQRKIKREKRQQKINEHTRNLVKKYRQQKIIDEYIRYAFEHDKPRMLKFLERYDEFWYTKISIKKLMRLICCVHCNNVLKKYGEKISLHFYYIEMCEMICSVCHSKEIILTNHLTKLNLKQNQIVACLCYLIRSSKLDSAMIILKKNQTKILNGLTHKQRKAMHASYIFSHNEMTIQYSSMESLCGLEYIDGSCENDWNNFMRDHMTLKCDLKF